MKMKEMEAVQTQDLNQKKQQYKRGDDEYEEEQKGS